MNPTWKLYIIPIICFVIGLFFFFSPIGGAMNIGLLLFFFAFFIFLYFFNVRLTVYKDRIVYGFFVKRTIMLNEITEAKNETVKGRYASAPVFVIKDKTQKVQLPVKSFKKEDLERLYSVLGV